RWINGSKRNQTDYLDHYIWVQKYDLNQTSQISWEYDVDRFNYYAKPPGEQGTALLNFANADVRAEVTSAALTWVSNKVDGIQAEGTGFWRLDPATGKVEKSKEIPLELHRAIRKGAG